MGWRETFDATPKFVEDFELDPRAEAADYFFNRINEVVIPNQVKLLSLFRKNRMRVTYLTVGPTLPDHSDYKRPISHEMGEAYVTRKLFGPVGTFEHSILEELRPRHGELILNKTSAGAFNSTGLDMILRNMGVTHLVIAGVASHACVETTSRDAADRGYLCVLVDDACAAHTQELHDGTMRSFAAVSGMVLNTDEIVGALANQSSSLPAMQQP